jgi:hypothetical protein
VDTIPLSETTSDLVLADVRNVAVTRVTDGSGHGGNGFAAGWITGLANTRLFLRDPKTHVPVIDRLADFPGIRQALRGLEFATHHHYLTQVMVNVLHGGGSLAAHRDGLPDDYRYHLPVVTNPEVVWWDELNGEAHMRAGYWHGPVPYCGVLHSVANGGTESRIHLVADFAKEPRLV